MLGAHLAHREQCGQGGVQATPVRALALPGSRGHHLRREQEEAVGRGGGGPQGDPELLVFGIRREGGFQSRFTFILKC